MTTEPSIADQLRELAASLREIAKIEKRADAAAREDSAVVHPEAHRLYRIALRRYYDPHDPDRARMDVLCEVLGTWADSGPAAALAWMRRVVEGE